MQISQTIKLTISALACVLCVWACNCSGDSTSSDEADAYISGLTSSDTSAVLNQTRECLELMLAGDYDSALHQIGYVDDDTLCHLSPERAEAMKKRFSGMCLTGYELVSMEFVGPADNTVVYRLSFGRQGTANMTTKFAFNPILIDGAWYLSIK